MKQNISLYIISDSTIIKRKFKRMYNKYNTYDVVNNCNVMFILKCNIIIGS